MLYSQEDAERNRKRLRSELKRTGLLALPFLCLLILGYALRNRWVAMTGTFLTCAELIFMIGMRVWPLYQYGRFLAEIRTGLSHETRGILIGNGKETIFEKGVVFREVFLNIYKDLGEDGIRRFLLDQAKDLTAFESGNRVILTSHGTYVIGIKPIPEGEEGK